MSRPQPPPEAQLIARKRNDPPHMPVSRAAARAGISDTRWSQLENGYRKIRGHYEPERAPADTLARMALAVGVTPDELEDAGRHDAAGELRVMLETRPSDPLSVNARLRHIEELLTGIRNELDERDEDRPKGGSLYVQHSSPVRTRPA